MKKYKLSTRISAYIAVILSLAMSGLTIRSLIVKRNVHSVSVTLYGIVFVLLLVVSAVSLIVYINKNRLSMLSGHLMKRQSLNGYHLRF